MIKIISILLISVSVLFSDILNSTNPINMDTQINSSMNEYKEKNKKEKLSYKELIAYLKVSNDKNKILILGVLYSTDSDKPDDYGEYIKADPILAKKYILKAYELGNKKALSILAGLIFYNDNMAKLDPKLEDAEKYLKQSLKEGVFESEIILGNVQLVKGKYQEGISTLVKSANRGDSSSQLQLALIFHKGIYSQEKDSMVVYSDKKVAEFYLNKACTNEKKSDQVRDFCYSNSVEMTNK